MLFFWGKESEIEKQTEVKAFQKEAKCFYVVPITRVIAKKIMKFSINDSSSKCDQVI